MGLCISAAGSIIKGYAAVAAFTLAWTHTVEKVDWQEDWRIAGDRLVLVEATVHGTGAGMEPPPDAHLDSLGWHWHPRVEPMTSVTLRRSGATPDWRLCIDGQCDSLAGIVPGDLDPVVLTACGAGAPTTMPGSMYDPSTHQRNDGDDSARQAQ